MLQYTEYGKVAEGYGGEGLRIGREDKEKIEELLLNAFDRSMTEKKPILLDVLIGRSSFRDGSISV